MASPAGDLAILFAVLWLLLRRFENRARPLLLLAVAASLLLLTDLIVSFQYLMGHFASGTWMQVGWLLSYGLLAIAGADQIMARPGRSIPMAQLVGRKLAGRLQAALGYFPYVLVVVACGVLLWDRSRLPTLSSAALSLGVAAVVMLVLLRQLLASRETERLLRAERRWRESDGILLELSQRLLSAQDEASVGSHAVEIAALALHANQVVLALPHSHSKLALQIGRASRRERV